MTAPQMSPADLNAMQRHVVLAQSVEMTQQIYSGTVTPSSNSILNIPVRPVGLVKRLRVEYVATFTNSAGATATLTDTGIANAISNVQLIDLNNNVRINTTGLHLAMLSNVKRTQPFGATADWNASYTPPNPDNLSQMLNVPPASWPVFAANPTIAVSSTSSIRGVLEIPLAFSDDDLRGAIWANVVNAQMQLTLTFNPTALVGAAPADYTNGVYQGSTGTFVSCAVTVYQDYLDQLPRNQQTGQVVLPIQDISTVYDIKNTIFTAIPAGQDFPLPYANFREFQSTFLIYNNNGAATGRTFGTDLNTVALQSANFTNIWKTSPLLKVLESRNITGADLPAGVYYFSHRRKPINTTQYGNMSLVLNASSASASAYAQAFYESFANVDLLSQAGSLAG